MGIRRLFGGLAIFLAGAPILPGCSVEVDGPESAVVSSDNSFFAYAIKGENGESSIKYDGSFPGLKKILGIPETLEYRVTDSRGRITEKIVGERRDGKVRYTQWKDGKKVYEGVNSPDPFNCEFSDEPILATQPDQGKK